MEDNGVVEKYRWGINLACKNFIGDNAQEGKNSYWNPGLLVPFTRLTVREKRTSFYTWSEKI